MARLVLEWSVTHPGNHQPQFSRAHVMDQILNVPYRHMCCMLVPQLVALFWEVLDPLGVRPICKKAGPGVGTGPWGISLVLRVSLPTSCRPWDEYFPSATGSRHLSQGFALEHGTSEATR